MMDALTKLALLGTGNASSCPSSNEQMDALIDPLKIDSVEDALLLKAGVTSFYMHAGRDAVAVNKLDAAPEESQEAISVPVERVVSKAFEPSYSVLLPDFLRVIDSYGMRVTPALLPQLLSAKDESIRELVRQVVGERGRWLANLNPEWSWLIKSDRRDSADAETFESLKQEFDHGSIKERCQILYAIRTKSPEIGRTWLADVFPTEGADARAQLLEQIAVGLSRDDEPFLESCLDGRSVNVRVVACDLLAQLPGSAFVSRMTQRANAMLSGQKSGMLRKTLKLVCQPPQELTKEDERDGLLEKPPTQTGKRSYWTEQILKAVPLSHWSKTFSSTPEELLNSIAKDDYAENILRGWLSSAISGRLSSADEEWLLPLWNVVIVSRFKIEQPLIIGLWNRLNPTLQETTLTKLLTSSNASLDSLPMNQLMNSLQQPWSSSFSKAYWSQFSKDLLDRRWLPSWATTFETAVVALPPEILESILKLDEPGSVLEQMESSYLKSAVSKFVEQARIRRQFYDIINRTIQ